MARRLDSQKQKAKSRPAPSRTGRLINYWRTRRGMEIPELAEAVGVSRPAVAQWESGATAAPSEQNLIKVVEALGLTMSGFYGAERELDKAAS